MNKKVMLPVPVEMQRVPLEPWSNKISEIESEKEEEMGHKISYSNLTLCGHSVCLNILFSFREKKGINIIIHIGYSIIGYNITDERVVSIFIFIQLPVIKQMHHKMLFL